MGIINSKLNKNFGSGGVPKTIIKDEAKHPIKDESGKIIKEEKD